MYNHKHGSVTMKYRFAVLLAAASISLGACADHTPRTPIEADTGLARKAEALGAQVVENTDGSKPRGNCGDYTSFLNKDVRSIDLKSIEAKQPVRVIYPGQAVTRDFREDRLNVEVDQSGRVIGIKCG